MRTAPLIVCSALVLCGCGERGAPLESVVQSLAKTWPRANLDIELTMRAMQTDGKIVLHCALKNTGTIAFTLDRSKLPWTAPARLNVSFIAADGRIPPRPPPPADISILEGAPNYVVIHPREILEGDIDLSSASIVPIGKLPEHMDMLVVWSYVLDISSPGHNPFFSGITFLKRGP